MYKYLIKRQNKTAEIFVVALFILSLAFFVSSTTGAPPSALSRLLCIAFFLLGVLLANRYLFTGFCYIIDIDRIPNILSIVQKQGRQQKTVCRIDLDQISTLEIIKPGRKNKKTPREQKHSNRRFNYCASLFPVRYILLVYDDYNEKAIIKLDADEGFVSMLTRFVDN